MKRTVFDWLLLSLCVITAVSCSKDDKYDDDVNGKGNDPSAVVVTLSATDVSFNGATLNGKLNVADELMPVVEFGFEYSKSADMSSPTKLAIKSMGTDKKFQGSVTGLKAETKYYYRTYMRYTSTGISVYGDVKSFTTTKFSNSSGKENGYEYVDLGLSVRWATCNVGASKPEENGSYFAWGETTSKSSYTWSNYKYCKGSSTTKYCTSSRYGTVDNKITLELSDDAASVNWGGNWRMPTSAEIEELRNNCIWEWTTLNGVNGYKVTGKKSGYTSNRIFLPAAGNRRYDYLSAVGSYGYYWSSSLNASNSDFAYYFGFGPDGHGRYDELRDYGRPVRPVCPSERYVSVKGVSVSSSMSLKIGESVTLTATVSPTNATDKSVEWTSNNTSVATVDSNGKVTAEFAGTALITAITTDGNNTATCTVTVELSSSDSENGHAYVDLGLPSGIKWAMCNVGASLPEEYGSYFAWGETVGDSYINGKDRGYTKSFDWSSYIHCYGSSDNFMTKYCTSSNYGTVDNRTTLELSDDAARANWGGSWRMPTATEIDELLNNCTWTWTTQNGVNGFKVTSKKSGYTNKSIFLPAAGCRYGDNLSLAGLFGNYWSSSLYSSDSSNAYDLYFYSDIHYCNNYYRCYGLSVRPVCP